MNAETDITGVVLKTERLTIREWKLSDLDDFNEYASVDGVGQMAGWFPHKDKEESLRILNHFITGKKTFAIEYEGKAIGSIGIEKYDENDFPELDELRVREIGYVLSKDYWGRGLMPEAVREMIRYMFEDMDLDAILCGHFLTNRQSARVQEKCGFRFYAYKTHQSATGEHETRINIITREEWMKNRS